MRSSTSSRRRACPVPAMVRMSDADGAGYTVGSPATVKTALPSIWLPVTVMLSITGMWSPIRCMAMESPTASSSVVVVQ